MMFAFERKAYFDEQFTHLTLEGAKLEHIEFEHCQFVQCKFSAVTFNKVKFTDCDFKSCDLSLSKFPGCTFSEVSFTDSKLMGINWTELNWPLVKLTSPLYFYTSNMSHSSFYGLVLADLIIENCKAHEVDFREANLDHSCFIGTDLQNSLFMRTSLKYADFTNAINYTIDPQYNRLTNASFSFPEVIALLSHLNIKINDWPIE